MNTITLPTRQLMRTFVQRANLLNNSKLFKSSAVKNNHGGWDALRVVPTITLKRPSTTNNTCKSNHIVVKCNGKPVNVVCKRSMAGK
jgi:hypothetical protein